MKISVKTITRMSIIAALYAVLTMVLAPISYGPVQFRISEVMTILPFFFPQTTVGLVIGCALANLLSMYGIPDVVFGSLATLLSSLIMALLGKLGRDKLPFKVLACLQPVIFNAVFVGALIAYATASEGAFWAAFALNAFQVGIGELAVLFVIGLPAMIYFPKTSLYSRLKEK